MVVLSDTIGAGIYAVPFLAAFLSRVATGRNDVALAAGMLSILLLSVALATVVVGFFGLDALLS